MIRHTCRLSLLALLAAPASAQSTLYTLEGSKALGQFGQAVNAVGDVDGDGVPDAAVGDPSDDIAGLDAGAVRVYSGVDGALVYTVYGFTPGDRLGVAIEPLADLDSDGVNELLLGAETAFSTGGVFLVNGATGQKLQQFPGTNTGGRFGSAIAALQTLSAWGVGIVKLISLIAARDGIRKVEAEFPNTQIYVCAIDDVLDSQKFIVPGLGDAGDRIFNTFADGE